MKPYDIRIIDAIVQAAEREGGIHMLDMPRKKRKWHRCAIEGLLWYNNIETHGTHVIRLKKK